MRYLVVANQTLGAEQLSRKVRECEQAGQCTFHLLVPATQPHDHLTWVEGEARTIARDRLDLALVRLRKLGVNVDGAIGDANPFLAIGDALRDAEFDHIILSTLPAGISRWLKLDLPSRVEAAFGLPVSHIISPASSSAAHGG
jgi:hypothetical protein